MQDGRAIMAIADLQSPGVTSTIRTIPALRYMTTLPQLSNGITAEYGCSVRNLSSFGGGTINNEMGNHKHEAPVVHSWEALKFFHDVGKPRIDVVYRSNGELENVEEAVNNDKRIEGHLVG
jgi:hypothetical protein